MARIFLIICLGVLWNSFNGLSQTTMSANTILQDNGTYTPPQIFMNDEIVQSSTLDNLKVNLADIFESEEE